MNKWFGYEIVGLALTAILLTTSTVNAGDGTSIKDEPKSDAAWIYSSHGADGGGEAGSPSADDMASSSKCEEGTGACKGEKGGHNEGATKAEMGIW